MNDNSSSNDNQIADSHKKPTVFYAKKTVANKPSKHGNQKNDGHYQSHSTKRTEHGKSSHDRHRSNYPKNNRENEQNSRIETFKPRSRNTVESSNDSPWKRRVQKSEQKPTFDDRDNTKLAQLNKYKSKDETVVYSENGCKAVFAKRPDAIIKAFFLQDKTYEFKALIAWLVEHRLGYDVVDEERMSKIAQTPHHGGVCLIVKKRQALTTSSYLSQYSDTKHNYVLAVDDINNPHNLGAIARTAAFFNVHGLLLRQPDILNNGASLRVSEGGAEYLIPIQADDFIVSLEQFRQQGYQIVAVLPCKVNAFKAENLTNLFVANKTVFVIFQQINEKLASFADKVVCLSGSDAMPALNISVLTGILLSKLVNNRIK